MPDQDIKVDIKLKKDVMRRVRFIHVMRFFLHEEVLKGMVFGASVFFVISVTHVSDIIQNMQILESNWLSYVEYVYGAYMRTTFVVQAIIGLALVAGAWLAFDAGKNVRERGWVPGLRRVG